MNHKLSRQTVWARIQRGWDREKAKNTPAYKPINVIGKKFHLLTVLNLDHIIYRGSGNGKRSSKTKSNYYLCKCDCGKTTVVEENKFKRGHTKSCGHLREDYRKRFQPIDDCKLCTICKKIKNVSEYYTSDNEIGMSNACKNCTPTQKEHCLTKNIPYREKSNINQREMPKVKFSSAISNAKRRGLLWSISSEDYFKLIMNPCFYCGKELPKRGTGLDRKDNDKGYSIENVVPCCTRCNSVRGNYFTYEEMRDEIAPVIRKLDAKRVHLASVVCEMKNTEELQSP